MMDLPIITHDLIVKGSGRLGNIDVSVAEHLLQNMKFHPNYEIVDAESGASITNRVMLNNIIALAEALKSGGVKANDVIGICSENRLEYPVPVLAVLSLGAAVFTINPLYTTEELKHVLSISKPSKIFCSPFTASKLNEVKSHFPGLNELIVFDAGDHWEGFTLYSNLLKKAVDINSFRCARVNPRESAALILCTSGTTGLPKCVDLTHSNLMCFINVVSYSGIMHSRTETTVNLGLIPFFHGYGMCLLICSLAIPMKLVILSKFEEKKFLETIEKYRITDLCLVPSLIVFLAKHPLVSKYDLSSVTRITCGAAPLSLALQVAAQKRLRLPNDIKQGYGMTELSVCTVLMPVNKCKGGSVGVVVDGMELKIVDTETGKALPPFKEGEICFRGPFIMKGYRNNPKATSEIIDSDGWLHTGDVGYYDDEGYLFIVDRLKELIKYKGFQVAPAEIEALLLTNPKIKDAAVIGIPNEEAGELPIAFVVKQTDTEITEAEIKNFVAGKVSPQKRLHHVKFVNEIPKNPSGKILRKELRAMVKKSKL